MKKTAEQKMLAQLKEIDRLDKLSDSLIETDEAASDEAYSKMWKLVEEVATLIVKSTHGQITNRIAVQMILYKREKLTALCKRFA